MTTELGTGTSASLGGEHRDRADAPMNRVHITIDGITRDVTSFVNRHPGGDILLHFAGEDATEAFYAMHGRSDPNRPVPSLSRAKKMFDTLPLVDKPAPKLSERNQELRDAMKDLWVNLGQQGLFHASLLWYGWKSIESVLLFSLSVWLTMGWENAFIPIVFGGLAFGIWYQQMGWFGHDFGHHMVFKNRAWNSHGCVAVGNLFLGFGGCWWKTRHNEHHACTNILGHDPDIDNLPVYAWDKRDLLPEPRRGPSNPTYLKWQWLYFFPTVALLKVIWRIQTILWIWTMKSCENKAYKQVLNTEIAYLVAHYIIFLIGMPYICGWNFWRVVGVVTVSELVGGFCIGIVVFMNHFPLPKSNEDEMREYHFTEVQTKHTCNVTSNPFADWFCGGLNFQIEHHLFPQMPRHSLSRAAPIVKEFCHKHDLPYMCLTPKDAVVQLVNWMQDAVEPACCTAS